MDIDELDSSQFLQDPHSNRESQAEFATILAEFKEKSQRQRKQKSTLNSLQPTATRPGTDYQADIMTPFPKPDQQGFRCKQVSTY